MAKYFSRLGDGSPVEMSAADLRRDLEEGSADAADRGRVPPLAAAELEYLFEVFSRPDRLVSVRQGSIDYR